MDNLIDILSKNVKNGTDTEQNLGSIDEIKESITKILNRLEKIEEKLDIR